MPVEALARHTVPALLADYSLEMTAKDLGGLVAAAPGIAPGTQISVTFLPHEGPAARVAAATQVRRLGLAPMPHISARRLASEHDLRQYLSALREVGACDRVFVIAGDPARPEGPYQDALAVIRSGLLEAHGVSHVGIAGYPEGHPDIANDRLRDAMLDKRAALIERGLSASIITQFGFDTDPVLRWLEIIRDAGVTERVRIGIPGPTSIARLLKFAARCGVGATASVMAKYGISMTRLLGSAGPDALVRDFAERLDAGRHGDVRLHFYPFGGLSKTIEWIDDHR